MPTRPLLAAKVKDVSTLRFPIHGLIATPKIDGIRLRVSEDGPFTRTNKQLPNSYVREYLENFATTGLDGELITYTFGEPDVFHTVQSKLMSEDGEPEFHYLTFDYCPTGWDHIHYFQRIAELERLSTDFVGSKEKIKRVPTTYIYTTTELEAYETQCLDAGFEGVCLRDPYSPYKSGRSTLNEQYLLKLKQFEDAEAVIIGYEELQRNTNIGETSELGYIKRSHAQAGLRPGGVLGALLVRDPRSGVEFSLGSGFTFSQRQELWERKDSLLGLLCTYKHQPYGRLDKPRIPIFKGLRYDLA